MDDNFKAYSIQSNIKNEIYEDKKQNEQIQKEHQQQINESKERIKRIDKAIEQFMFIFKIWAVIFPVILIAIMCGYIWWIK